MRLLYPWHRLAAASLVVGLAAAAGSAAPAFSQQPPMLLPPSPPSHFILFQVEAPAPAQYEEALSVLDFEPGAWTYERKHNGMAFFSVSEGTVTSRRDGKDTLYTRGESFRQDAGVFYSVGNTGAVRARLVQTTLTSPSLEAEADHPSATRPAKLPTTAFSGKTTFGNVPARFSLNQLIIEFRPGAGSGAHSHPAGQGLVIVMAGEHRHRLLGRDVTQKAGESFVDGPAGRPVSHENHGTEMLRVVGSYVFWGMPAAVPESIPGVAPLPAPAAPATAPAAAPAPLPAVRPPSTGDAGLAGD